MATAKELIAEGAQVLLDAPDVELSWRGEDKEQATQLLAHVLGRDPKPNEVVPPAARRRYDGFIARRATGEPVALILGYTEFRGLKLDVRPGVFIPRATSEFMADVAIQKIRRRRDAVHVDVATGVGTIALSVAKAVPKADVHGTDLSADAVRMARHNARKLGLRNASFHRGDLFSALPDALRGQVDLITIHPPYVPRGEVKLLPTEIREFEPLHTLTDHSRDGLGLIHRVVDESWDWMCEGAWLVMETHPSDVRYVKGLMQRTGFSDVRSNKGELRWTRVLTGRAS